MLQINTRQADDVTVLNLSGELIFGPTSNSLAQQVKGHVADNQKKILINLTGVTFIDSCGVGELIAGFTSVRKSGGVLKVCGATDHVDEVLRIVRFSAIIEIFDTEAEALASFASAD